MAIEFHCPRCGKLVRAPDEAGGKRGKCPTCGHISYIPMPDDQLEEIDLAPIDEEEERRRRALEEESLAAEMQLLKEKQTGPDLGPARPDEGGIAPETVPLIPQRPEDVEALTVEWIRSMADGDIADADRTLALLRQNRQAAIEAVGRLAGQEPPPADLIDLPRPVLDRYFKSLIEQL